jgi:Flp pilus assembly protein TadG
MSSRTSISDRGSVSVELAITVPLLILLLMFLVLCGRAASAAIDLNAAAAAAARAAAHTTDPAAATAAAEHAATATTGGWDCVTRTDTSGLRRGGQVAVTVACRVPLADLGLPVPAVRTLTASATQPVDTYQEGTP